MEVFEIAESGLKTGPTWTDNVLVNAKSTTDTPNYYKFTVSYLSVFMSDNNLFGLSVAISSKDEQ